MKSTGRFVIASVATQQMRRTDVPEVIFDDTTPWQILVSACGYGVKVEGLRVEDNHHRTLVTRVKSVSHETKQVVMEVVRDGE